MTRGEEPVAGISSYSYLDLPDLCGSPCDGYGVRFASYDADLYGLDLEHIALVVMDQ